MIKKRYSRDGASCTVTFVIEAEQATGVEQAVLSGDFNNWSRDTIPMKATKDGGFEASVRLDTGREYHYRYLFDGYRWENDWHADKYAQSPFRDAENSVVIT